MPVQLGGRGAAGSGAAEDRLPMLERELGNLRRELESLRAGSAGSAHNGLATWMTTALAAAGTLLGLIALVRH